MRPPSLVGAERARWAGGRSEGMRNEPARLLGRLERISARFGHHLLFASRAQTCAPPAGGARRVRSIEFGAGLRPPTRPHPVTRSVRRVPVLWGVPFRLGEPQPRPRV